MNEKIEHWADAGFITIINDEIFAQISPISQQRPKLSNSPSISLVDGTPNSWLAIISTKGSMEQRFAENEMTKRLVNSMRERGATEEEISKRLESMNKAKVKTKWQ